MTSHLVARAGQGQLGGQRGEERTSAAQGLQGLQSSRDHREEKGTWGISAIKFQTQMPLRAVKGGGETDDDGGGVEFEWNQQRLGD